LKASPSAQRDFSRLSQQRNHFHGIGRTFWQEKL